MAEYTQQSIWNIDDERLKQLNYYLIFCEESFVDWDLQGIYTYLHAVKRVASAKLQKYKGAWDKKDEDGKYLKETVKGHFLELEDKWRKFSNSNSSNLHENKINFYNKAQEVYEFLSAKLQEHGFFFREGLDPGKAAMRR